MERHMPLSKPKWAYVYLFYVHDSQLETDALQYLYSDRQSLSHPSLPHRVGRKIHYSNRENYFFENGLEFSGYATDTIVDNIKL